MTKDTTATPAGRERADSEPLGASLRVGELFGDQIIWLDSGDNMPMPVIADYDIQPSIRSEAWALLVAAIEKASR